MVEEIRDLYAYDRWASQRTLEGCASVPPDELARDLGSSFPSVIATLGHILAADWIWLERWSGRSPTAPPEEWDLSSLHSIGFHRRKVEDRRAEFLSSLNDSGLLETIPYRNTAGESYSAPLWQLMRHVVNHATYHRGQVATMLRQLGYAAPATDLVLYHRSLAGGGG